MSIQQRIEALEAALLPNPDVDICEHCHKWIFCIERKDDADEWRCGNCQAVLTQELTRPVKAYQGISMADW